MVSPRIQILAVATFAAAVLVSPATQLETRIVTNPDQSRTAVLGVSTSAGKQYVVFASGDLESWQQIGEPITGNGLYQEVSVSAPDGAKYFRVSEAAYWDGFTWDDFTWR